MDICRVCGVKSEQPNKYEEMEKYVNIYLQVTAVQFHDHEDRQLLKICPSCIEKLQSIDEFRKDCLTVHWEKFKLKTEPEDDDNDSCDDAPAEPFEVVAITEVVKAESLSSMEEGEEEKDKPKVRKQRTKKGTVKKQPPLQLKCDRCPEVFQDTTLFNGHKRTHDGLLPYTCEICNVDFSSLLDMQLHSIENHTEDRALPCPDCNEVLNSRQGLSRHRKRVHDPNFVEPTSSPFICEICANVYTTKQSLKRHIYSHTPDERPYVCDFCQRKFSNLNALKAHLNRHKGIKNHVCPYCGVQKTTKTELRSHYNNIHKKEHLPPLTSARKPTTEPKKPKNYENWKRTLRKEQRNSGKAYVSSNNVVIPGKSFRENFNCGCPKNCPSLFSSQSAVQEFFNSYWNLADWHKQNVLLRSLVKAVEIQRRRNKTAEESARSRNFHYFIPDGTDRIRVCKRYFLGVIQIGWGRVYRRVVETLKDGE